MQSTSPLKEVVVIGVSRNLQKTDQRGCRRIRMDEMMRNDGMVSALEAAVSSPSATGKRQSFTSPLAIFSVI